MLEGMCRRGWTRCRNKIIEISKEKGNVCIGGDVPFYRGVIRLLFPGRHFWKQKCRKKTWWQQEFAVFKCEAMAANSVTGHVCVNSNVILKIWN